MTPTASASHSVRPRHRPTRSRDGDPTTGCVVVTPAACGPHPESQTPVQPRHPTRKPRRVWFPRRQPPRESGKSNCSHDCRPATLPSAHRRVALGRCRRPQPTTSGGCAAIIPPGVVPSGCARTRFHRRGASRRRRDTTPTEQFGPARHPPHRVHTPGGESLRMANAL